MSTILNGLRGVLLTVLRFVLRSPKLKRTARRALQYFPRLQASLQAIVFRSMMRGNGARSASPQSAAELSPRASRQYQALKQAKQIQQAKAARKT